MSATRAVINPFARQAQAPNAGSRHLNGNNQPTGVPTISVSNPLQRKPR
jgi:hypothetical protein